MLHLTNPCAKRKVLILTKLKGKIYKTKSIRHYITVVLIVSTPTLISKSSSPCTNPLVTVPKAAFSILITVTFMFHSFFNSQQDPGAFFSLSFNFTLWSSKTAKSTIWQVHFFFFFVDYNFIWFSGRDKVIHSYLSSMVVCMPNSQGQNVPCASTVPFHGQTSISCTIPSGSPCPPTRV